LSQSRLSNSATRQTAYGHIHEIASAPASRFRSPCEVESPLAFANHERLTRFPAPRIFPFRVPPKPQVFPGDHARRGQRAVEVRSKRVRYDRPTRLSTIRAKVQPRTDCPEAKGSQPFGRLASSPPSKAAEHPSVTNLLPRTPGVRPSRLAWSIAPSFPGGEGPRLASQAGLGPHSTALPRRRTVCAKTRVLSTDRPERVRGSPPLRARSVSPSRRPRGALRA